MGEQGTAEMNAVRKIPATPERVVRDAAFAKRLTSACDANPHCPPLHKGRLTWIKTELKRRFRQEVSVETARKWFAGEAKPRQEKVAMLAELLMVDVSWLSLGIDKGLAPREMRAHSREIDGAVNVLAGLIEMDGGHAAFASDADHKRGIDIHAIIKGAKYDFHVAMQEDGLFRVQANLSEVVVLGLIKKGFRIEVVEIPDDVIATSDHRGGMIEVKATHRGLRKIESFDQRLG